MNSLMRRKLKKKQKIRDVLGKKEKDGGFYTLMALLEERGLEQGYGSLLLMLKVSFSLSNLTLIAQTIWQNMSHCFWV